MSLDERICLQKSSSLMFETLCERPVDPLLALIGEFRQDRRQHKIDLGVGVYRNEAGDTPILRAVSSAETRLLETQRTKAYIGPEGDVEFVDRLWHSISGEPIDARRMAGVQTPGGSGALRLAADLLCLSGSKRIWVGTPSWPNHAGIFRASGLDVISHPFFDPTTQTLLWDEMDGALSQAQAGDAILLQASCHNPSGSPTEAANWDAMAQRVLSAGLVPLIDNAYQGFGTGYGKDAEGFLRLLAAVPEALIAVSCSKNFGLYRERTGAIYLHAADATGLRRGIGNLLALARVNYSMPPAHGAAIVRTILAEPELHQCWLDELDEMGNRVRKLRQDLATALAPIFPPLAKIAEQQGMFSMLPLDAARINRLRSEFAIFMPLSGRINIAGMRRDQIQILADALIASV